MRTCKWIWLAGDGHILGVGAVVLAPSVVRTVVQWCLSSRTSHVLQPYIKSTAGTEYAQRYYQPISSAHNVIGRIRISIKSTLGFNQHTGQLALTVLEGITEGLRHQGRPRRQWIHDIEEWTGCEYIQLKEMSSTMEKKDIGVVVCCRQPSSRKVD